MTDRIPLDDLTSDQLDALYDQLAAAHRRIKTLEHVAAGNKRHVQAIVPDLERAEAALVRVHHLADLIHAGAPWLSNHTETAARIRNAIAGPASAATEAAEPDPFSYEERERTGRNSGLHLFTVAPRDPAAEQAAEERAREMADQHETTARVFAGLHQSAEDTVSRVITLHEQWVAAGPPPLGTSLSRWWDKRLVELHNAIQPPANPTTEK